MLKIVLFVSLMFSTIFANVDGHIDIVKRTNSIPKVAVSMASDSSSDFTLSRLKKSLEDDLNVSGHFELKNKNKKL